MALREKKIYLVHFNFQAESVRRKECKPTNCCPQNVVQLVKNFVQLAENLVYLAKNLVPDINPWSSGDVHII